jgi:hypothetical protein
MTNSYGSISFLVGNLYTWFFSGQFAALPLSLRAILCGVIITLYLLIFHRRPVAQPAQIPVTQMGMTVFPMPQPTTAPVTPPPGMTYVAPSPGPSYAPASTVITPEMKAINNWFFEHNLPMQVIEVNPSPDYDCYRLTRAPKASWSQLTQRVLDDLKAEIYEHRGGRGEPVTVVFENMPPMLKVSRVQREPLAWSCRLQGMPKGTAQLGAKMVGSELHPVLFNTYDANFFSIGVFSSSGGGKSTLLNAAALSLLEVSDPMTEEFYFIDLDSAQWLPYAVLPQVKYVASTEVEAMAVINHLKKVMDEDFHQTDHTRRYLIIDELQMLTEDSVHAKEFQTKLGYLAQRSRKHGGYLLSATQDPTGNNYPSDMQRNTGVVLAGSTLDDSYLSRYFHLDGACDLRGNGDFLARAKGHQSNFKGFLVGKAEVSDTLKMLVARYGRDERMLDLTPYLASRTPAEALDLNALPPMQGNTKQLAQQRTQATIARILEIAEQEGQFPTKNRIREWYNEAFKAELNNKRAGELLTQAQQHYEEGEDNDEA